MFCSHCGAQNNEGNAFCLNCGRPLKKPAAPSEAAGAQAQPAANAPAQPGFQPQTPQTAYRQPAAQEGVLGAAWRDITGTQGWFKKILFLCLVGCVPILNFSVSGYALRWSRELSFGKRNPLPREIFRKKEILTGFRAWLAQLSLGFVYCILGLLATLLLSAFFGLFSVQAGATIAALVFIVLSFGMAFFWLPLVNVSIMRMTAVDYLEAALNLPKTFKAFKRAMGGAIGATIVPPLLSGLVTFLLFTLIGGIIGASAASNFSNLNSLYGMYGMTGFSPAKTMTGLLGIGTSALFLYLLLGIVSSMLGTFAMLITWRAMGHWTARYASEWIKESDEEFVLQMAEDRAAPAAAAATAPPTAPPTAPAAYACPDDSTPIDPSAPASSAGADNNYNQ